MPARRKKYKTVSKGYTDEADAILRRIATRTEKMKPQRKPRGPRKPRAPRKKKYTSGRIRNAEGIRLHKVVQHDRKGRPVRHYLRANRKFSVDKVKRKKGQRREKIEPINFPREELSE